MRKKILWIAGIFIIVSVMIAGIMQYIEMQRRERDPDWDIAKEIYKVENTLKEVDEDYECKSISML